MAESACCLATVASTSGDDFATSDAPFTLAAVFDDLAAYKDLSLRAVPFLLPTRGKVCMTTHSGSCLALPRSLCAPKYNCMVDAYAGKHA